MSFLTCCHRYTFRFGDAEVNILHLQGRLTQPVLRAKISSKSKPAFNGPNRRCLKSPFETLLTLSSNWSHPLSIDSSVSCTNKACRTDSEYTDNPPLNFHFPDLLLLTALLPVPGDPGPPPPCEGWCPGGCSSACGAASIFNFFFSLTLRCTSYLGLSPGGRRTYGRPPGTFHHFELMRGFATLGPESAFCPCFGPTDALTGQGRLRAFAEECNAAK